MADKQVNRHRARANQPAGHSACRPGKDGTGHRSCADCSAILDAVAFQARARRDGTFAADARPRSGCSGGLSVQHEARAVGEDHRLRLQSHGAVAARMARRYLHHAAVDLRSGGNHYLSPSTTSEATRVRKASPWRLVTVESRCISLTRMLVPSTSSPGRGGRGCTMSPSGS